MLNKTNYFNCVSLDFEMIRLTTKLSIFENISEHFKLYVGYNLNSNVLSIYQAFFDWFN